MLLNTAFPRVGRMLFWTARLSPRGVLAYVALRVALIEAILRWAEWGKRMHEEQRAALAAELGRDPTEEELHDALMKRYAD